MKGNFIKGFFWWLGGGQSWDFIGRHPRAVLRIMAVFVPLMLVAIIAVWFMERGRLREQVALHEAILDLARREVASVSLFLRNKHRALEPCAEIVEAGAIREALQYLEGADTGSHPGHVLAVREFLMDFRFSDGRGARMWGIIFNRILDDVYAVRYLTWTLPGGVIESRYRSVHIPEFGLWVERKLQEGGC